MIKKINAAFEVLSNREKRRQYDETDFNDWSRKEDKVVRDEVDNNNMKYHYYKVHPDRSSSYHHNRHENAKINNNSDLDAELNGR
jgi:curved DNA-binding protein CbpA